MFGQGRLGSIQKIFFPNPIRWCREHRESRFASRLCGASPYVSRAMASFTQHQKDLLAVQSKTKLLVYPPFHRSSIGKPMVGYGREHR